MVELRLELDFLPIFRLNWIVMLGNEYFDKLEHYCFEKYDVSDLFSQSVTSVMTSCNLRCKLQNLANDVIIVYFDFLKFFISSSCLFDIF